jgi:hypothetical protein
MVRRAHRIGDVAEVDLVLPGRVLGDRALGRQVLRGAETLEMGEERVLSLDLIQAVDLHVVRDPASRVPHRHWRPVGLQREQVELELERRDRPQPQFLELLRDPGQDGARIGEERRAVVVAQARQHLRTALAPGYRRQARAVDQARPVRVALLPDQARGVDVGARGVERVDRGGEAEPAPQRGAHGSGGQPLAAGDADEIRDDQIDRSGLGEALEEPAPGGLPLGIGRRCGPAHHRPPKTRTPRLATRPSLRLRHQRLGMAPGHLRLEESRSSIRAF